MKCVYLLYVYFIPTIFCVKKGQLDINHILSSWIVSLVQSPIGAELSQENEVSLFQSIAENLQSKIINQLHHN